MGTVAGIPVDPITGEPRTAEGLLALRKQQEEEREAKKEREAGFDPLRAAGLAAGASLLRNSGWRRTPMTLGEQIGHAIPAGMEAYYNQDALNQNEQQALYDRQQAEQTALDEKQQAEVDATQIQTQRINFQAAMKGLNLSHKDQTWFMSIYDSNPQKAHELLEKRMTEKEKEGGETFRILSDEEVKRVAPKLPTDGRTWKINEKTNDILEVTFKDEKEKGGTFRENILKTINGKQQVRRVLFNADGSEKQDLGPVDFEDAPDIKQTWNYMERDKFNKEYGNVASQLWPEGALLAEHNEKRELKGFHMPNNKYVPVGVKGVELSLRERGVTVQEATLDLKEEAFVEDQERYNTKRTSEMMQQAKENKWSEARFGMEKTRHVAQMAQMAKNYEARTNYMPVEEFIDEFDLSKGNVPEGVAFVEVDKDGTVKKFIKPDFSTWVEPLNNDAIKGVKEEIDLLYKSHSFTDTQKKVIRGLRLNHDDPMEALKQAHAFMTEERKLIQAPASILKKYQSDMGVRRAAEEALAMMNDPKQMAIIEKEVGFFYGQVTEKAKHPLFQKFKAIATMAALTKRHELIGSQMTDGELKFTEPMFPSNKDTKQSLMIKLKTMLTDANFNIGLTRNMFSKGAGYNDAVWGDDSTKWWKVNKDGTVEKLTNDADAGGGAGEPMSRDELMKKGG